MTGLSEISRPTVAVSNTPSAAQDAARHRRVVDAAQQFEAVFLQEMMKPFNQAADGQGDAGSGGSQGGVMQGFATESMARAIASSGGLGIARQVVAQVEQERARQHKDALTSTAAKIS